MNTLLISGPGVTPYEVVIGRGLLADAGAQISPYVGAGRIAVVSDATVADLHGPGVVKALEGAGAAVDLLTVPPGEASKSMPELTHLLDRLLGLGLDRRSTVVALGGGVVGDLAGLAAALFMRGIPVIQAPTTLLAQVDSSVGGKTAIDTAWGKNLIGVFHHPRRVLADLDVLATLPDRQMRAGTAEILKAAILADAGFFDWLEGHVEGVVGRDPAILEHAIGRAVAIKAEIVAEDPTERGRRALLNLGHTFAHALEAEAGFEDDSVLHGEAVALGCVLACRLSERLGRLSTETVRRVERLTALAGLPTEIEALGLFEPDALIARMAGDKKAEGGVPVLILADAIGQAAVVRGVDAADLRAVLQ
ncbi:MAG: 3-dehydroquinate synthase [Caulobacterales bacterium]|nr:3-dehydroquinate synthase [Caulobacterales bacterium]